MSPDKFMETHLRMDGPCQVAIGGYLFKECQNVPATDQTRRIWLAVLLAIKLWHAVAHVLMMKISFNNQMNVTPVVDKNNIPTTDENGNPVTTLKPYLSPGGLLKGESGEAFEIEVFNGVIRNARTKGRKWVLYLSTIWLLTQTHALTVEDHHGRPHLLPVQWGRDLLTHTFWTTANNSLIPQELGTGFVEELRVEDQDLVLIVNGGGSKEIGTPLTPAEMIALTDAVPVEPGRGATLESRLRRLSSRQDRNPY
ncbi:uncharacterized protein EV422DRAFT_581589 [Fimicolochytrium jonesii]|uniref:uncharacterized protein n=1 Tax=Fimicolochytrium jonesii TaxID=1396493 RepID=UPI0022FED01E|nr:uncharacterized protein EV422DRAFT_581589 [Fimicolochytrium jonesii]KAI8816222.1 hypothetical protein EV422DRAFT_581589 [Fimicolochytrium jonesii]